jgi:hypothetical protein
MYQCDYHDNCSHLFKALETAKSEKDLRAIERFLDTGSWPGFSLLPDYPPQKQARTWVVRMSDGPAEWRRVEWRRIPLHVALMRRAPNGVVARLVRLYPESVRCIDERRRLPLHLALRYGADDQMVVYLLMHYPDAVHWTAADGRSPIDCALAAKNKIRGKMLQLFVEEYGSSQWISPAHRAVEGAESSGESESDRGDGPAARRLVEAKNAELDQVLSLFKDCRAELEERRRELQDAREDYETMRNLKETMESDLLMQLAALQENKAKFEAEQALKTERLREELLIKSLEVQKLTEELHAVRGDYYPHGKAGGGKWRGNPGKTNLELRVLKWVIDAELGEEEKKQRKERRDTKEEGEEQQPEQRDEKASKEGTAITRPCSTLTDTIDYELGSREEEEDEDEAADGADGGCEHEEEEHDKYSRQLSDEEYSLLRKASSEGLLRREPPATFHQRREPPEIIVTRLDGPPKSEPLSSPPKKQEDDQRRRTMEDTFFKEKREREILRQREGKVAE